MNYWPFRRGPMPTKRPTRVKAAGWNIMASGVRPPPASYNILDPRFSF